MPNNCIITISRGKNKGKSCKDVNVICRHQQNVCPNCGEHFSYKHTYIVHAKSCGDQEAHNLMSSAISSSPSRSDRKKKVNVIKKSDLLERITSLEQRNRDLEDKVDKVEKQPRINNIMVIGTDLFQELAAKIGKDNAVEFLTCSATSGKAIDVIDKLYLEGKDRDAYPIACRDQSHFRYLSKENKVVDDMGGSRIGDMMLDRLRNAFLMAANELITKHVENNDAESNPEHFMNVQRNIDTVCDKNIIVYQLAEATSNSSHPFFRDEEEQQITVQPD